MFYDNRSTLVKDLFDSLEMSKRAMFVQFYKVAESANITPQNLRLLFIIAMMQPVQPKDLAGKMFLTPGAITQSLDALAEEGFVTRELNSSDRRSMFIGLSPKGKDKVAELKKGQQQRFAAMVEGLSDRELKAFLHAQQKMLAYLERESKEIK